MNAQLHERTVLVLNRNWMAVDAITPAEAFSHLSAGTARGLEITGSESIRPLGWNAWRELPVPSGGAGVGTIRGVVRVPRVILLSVFERVPLRVPRFGLRGLWLRDRGLCQYTGRRLAPGEGDIDHVVPRSRGGPTSWENCVLSDRRVNRRKGARTPEEAGLRLLRRPFAPKPQPAEVYLRNLPASPAWELFLGNASGNQASSR